MEIKKAHFNIIPNFALCGKSSSGKTYSALLFARGFVGEKGKIVVIDTENGRSEAYASDSEVGQFNILKMQAPFTPERYVEAYNMACDYVGDKGMVIIDSASHEWEGIGGVLEIAEEQTDKYGKPLTNANKWNKPKMEHKKLVQAIASPKVPTIICFRIKDKLIDVQDPQKGTTEEIVTEKNFHYELTTILKLEVGTHKAKVMKAPKPLHDIVKDNCIITKEMGEHYACKLKQKKLPEKSIEDIKKEISSFDNADDIRNHFKKYYTNHSQKKDIVQFCTETIDNLYSESEKDILEMTPVQQSFEIQNPNDANL